MAEFLVFNKEHWMDSLTQKQIDEQVAKDPDHFMDKYNSRYRKGDIVEVKPDGYWFSRTGHGKECFALVIVAGMSYEDAKHYMDTYIMNDKIFRTRKYQMDMTQISLDVNKKASLSSISNAYITDKSK